jgi:two-component system cell cycle sensor histidine kinase/response regulator CckA
MEQTAARTCRTASPRRALDGTSAHEGDSRLGFEQSPNPAWICDRASLEVLAANDSAVRHFGYSRDELLAMTLDRICSGAGSEFANQEPEYDQDQPARCSIRRKDGETVPVDLTAQPVEYRGCPATFVEAVPLTERPEPEADCEPLVWTAPPDGRIVLPQSRWTDFTGQTDAEMSGDGWLDAIHPGDRVLTAEAWAAAVSQGRPCALEHRVRARNGEYRLMAMRALPVPGAHQAVGEWVVIHEIPAGPARAGDERFRRVFTDLPFGIALVNPRTRRIEEANRAMAALFGYEIPELAGRHIREVTGNTETGEGGNASDPVFAGDVPSCTAKARFQRKDGSDLFGRVSVSALRDSSGQLQQVLVMFEDASEQLNLERQLRQAQKMEAVGRLAGGIAHDFNNVLTVIMGHAALLSRDLPPGPALSGLSEIQSAAALAAGLTHQLLTFSRKEAKRVREVNLSELVTRTTRMLRRVIGEDIELAVSVEQGPCLVGGNPTQFEQVLVNLAVNARDAMPRGGRLSIELSRVLLNAREAAVRALAPGAYARLRVSDTGCGMDEATRCRIFEPFFTTKDVGKGTGLGLSMVYAAIQQDHGNITVESEPGRGARFEIHLPLMGAFTPAACAGNREIRAASVLLVEEETTVRRLMADILSDAKYSVTAVASTKEAIRTAEANDMPFDLLVTEILPGGITGTELFAKLRERRPGIEVLYLSSYVRDSEDLLPAGAPCLAKPFSPPALLEAVAGQLEEFWNVPV